MNQLHEIINHSFIRVYVNLHVCVCVCTSYPVSLRQSWVTHSGGQQTYQQVLHLTHTVSQIKQAFLQQSQRGDLGLLHPQHLPKATQELHHHQAIREHLTGQHQPWYTRELRERLWVRRMNIYILDNIQFQNVKGCQTYNDFKPKTLTYRTKCKKNESNYIKSNH